MNKNLIKLLAVIVIAGQAQTTLSYDWGMFGQGTAHFFSRSYGNTFGDLSGYQIASIIGVAVFTVTTGDMFSRAWSSAKEKAKNEQQNPAPSIPSEEQTPQTSSWSITEEKAKKTAETRLATLRMNGIGSDDSMTIDFPFGKKMEKAPYGHFTIIRKKTGDNIELSLERHDGNQSFIEKQY
ncbi:MAG: hypothetical protein WC707_02975 [Candidatus Babeliaceae bacterium]|jgi:hypothetical protein